GDATSRHERTCAFLDMAVEIPEDVGVGEGPQQTGLGGYVNLLPFPRLFSVGVGPLSAHRGVGSSPTVGLRKRYAEGGAIRITGERHASAERHNLNVGRFELGVGSGLAEGRNGGQYDARINVAQRAVPQIESVQIARRKRLDDKIGFGCEPEKNFAAL